MKWPTHTDYQDSIQNPESCFSDADSKAGTIKCDMLGLPRVLSGNFASVYELSTPTGRWAIRCFVRQVMGQQGRYARLSQYLTGVKLDCMVGFEYILKGILVQGDWYPVVKMEWVQGQQLNAYVEDHVQEPDTLRQMAAKWRVMVNGLRGFKLAHGDLQQGNVMVTAEGELRLVDYDGMYCPAFGRGRSPELGHINFQHPRRTPEYYEEGLDNFAALVVYLSVLALAKEPELWAKFYNGDNLLLSSADFRNTQQSAAFQRLKQSPDPAVAGLSDLVRQCCIAPISCTPWFEDAIQALEKGTLGELTASVAAQASGTVMITQSKEPLPEPEEDQSQPAAEPPRGTRASPATATARAAGTRPSPPSGGTRPSPPEPTATATPAPAAAAGKKNLWIALAAGGVLLAAGAAWFFTSGGKKPAPVAAAPPAPAPAQPPAQPTPSPAPAQPPPAQPRPPAAATPGAKAGELKTLAVQAGAVTWVGFSGNGRWVATGTEDGTIKLWDPGSGKAKQTLAGQGDGVHAASFLPDAKTLVSVSGDNTIRYWDITKGQATKTVSDHTRNLWAVAISADGEVLATGASDRKIVRLLDPQTGNPKRVLPPHASWVRSVDFSPDGKLLAVACWDDTIKLWLTGTGEPRQTLTVLSNTVDGVRFSPDGTLLASGGQGRTVRLWDTQTGALKQTLIGHSSDVRSYAFSPSGRFIASGSEDKTVRVWDVASGQLRQNLGGHTDAVVALAFSADGSLLASGSADQTVKLWDVSKLNP